jgi:hypothetical protein
LDINETNTPYSSPYSPQLLQKCFSLQRQPFLGSTSEIVCFTSLFFAAEKINEHPSLRLQGQASSALETNPIHLDLDISTTLDGLRTLESFQRVYPKTLEEGKNLYSLFNEIHLERGHGFRKLDQGEVYISSMERAGTYTYAWMIEEILGEFVNAFPRFNLEDWPLTSHGMVSLSKMEDDVPNPITSITVLHRSIITMEKNKRRINRAVSTVRNFMVAFDSHFNLFASDKDMTCKIYGVDYIDDPLFDHWISIRINSVIFRLNSTVDSIPILYSRYEDLTNQPIQALENIIRFITGIPIEFTGYQKKIKEYIGQNGLTSSYRSFKKEKKMDDGVPADRKGMKKFKRKHLEEVYETMKGILDFFDYSGDYLRELGLPETPENTRDGFLEWNKEVIESLSKYQYQFNGKIPRQFWKMKRTGKSQWKGMDFKREDIQGKFKIVCPEFE